ncbi:hypothetical protein Tco_1061386 [Tanacetum coccineum]
MRDTESEGNGDNPLTAWQAAGVRTVGRASQKASPGATVRSLILERPSSHQMMQTTLPVWNGLDRADRLFVHCVEL